MENQIREHWYTVEEIAIRLNVHPETVRRLIKRKELTAIKVGGEWRITPQALQAYEDTHKSNAAA